MSQPIVPTVGRIVYFRKFFGSDAEAAIVCGVISIGDQYLLNLKVFDFYGHSFREERVPLIQPDQDIPSDSSYCRWMPYQVKKTTGSESGEAAAGVETI